VGAGVVVAPDPHAIRDGVWRVLEDESYAAASKRLAAEMRSHASTDAAVKLLGALAGGSGSP
jgi:UDP:flavonoid glycosyltransferase YjiC (YdhE family)